VLTITKTRTVRMRILSGRALLAGLFLFTPSLFATAFSFTGTFTADDDQQIFDFAISTQTVVTLQTWSFAGGTNAASQSIAAGGFSPVLSLFDTTAFNNLLIFDNGGVAPGGCGARNVDPVTGFCLDAYLSATLSTGQYIVVLTENDNTPNGPTLSDGFFEQGNGNFTGGPFFLNAGGGFQRNGAWAVDITGVDSAGQPGVPEPSNALLASGGILLLIIAAAVRRRAAWRIVE